MPRLVARSLAFAAVCSSALAFAAPAFADPSAADKETARTWVLAGREKRKSGDLKGALERFRAAHALMHLPTTGIEVGRTELQLGLLLEARDTLLAITRMPVQKGEPKVFKEARVEAQQLADDLAPRIPTLAIVVTALEPGSKLLLDGVELDPNAAHLSRKVNPGRHTVVLSLHERSVTEELELAERENKTLELDGAKVRPVAAAPARPSAAPAPPKAEVSSGLPTLAWIGFGVGVAGLAAGGVTGLLSNQKAAELKEQCLPDGRCPSALHGELATARTYATISTVSFITAGVGAVLGTIAVLAAPRHPKTAALSLDVGLGSLSLRGAF